MKFTIREHINVETELFDVYDIGSNNYITEENE